MSCKKDPLPEPDPPPIAPTDTNRLYIVWKKNFYNDSSRAYFLNPYFYEDYVAFCCDRPEGVNNISGMGVFKKSTGENHPLWNWEPGIIDILDGLTDFKLGGENNRYVLTCNNWNVECFDIITATRKWRIQIDHTNFRIGVNGNYVYFSQEFQTHANLFRANIETGDTTKIFTIPKTNGYEPSIESFGGWVSPVGDSVLIFQSRQWNFSTSDGKVDIYAYNLSADSVLWVLEDITEDGNSSVCPPNIIGNKLVFQGMRSQHCIDLITGKMLWEHKPLNQSFSTAENLYANGKIFAYSYSGFVFCYDVASGNLEWMTLLGYQVLEGRMAYYNGNIYLSGGSNYPKLNCLSASTGQLIWQQQGPLGGGEIKGGVIIDPATGYLYCNNSVGILCIDLNKTPKPLKK